MEKADRIGRLLVQEGLITDQQLSEALEKQQTGYANKPLGEVMIDQGILKEDDFLRILAKQFRTQYVTSEKLAALNIPSAILRLVPVNIAEKHAILPIQYSKKDKSLSVVTPDPMNVGAIDEVKFVSGIGNIRALVALQSSVVAGIEKFYKGNDRAFDLTISMEEGTGAGGFDQGYQDMMEMMTGGKNEIVLEPDGETASDGAREQVELEPDGEFGEADTTPDAADEAPLPPRGGSDNIYLGGMEEFPGDNNIARDEIASRLGTGAGKSIDAAEPSAEEAPPKKAETSPKIIEKAKEAKKYHRKMLVVEPHDQIRKFITKLFKREGFEVEGVPDRETCLSAIGREEYDMVVIKEDNMGEGSEFEEKVAEIAPNVEVHPIKNYGSAVVGETRLYHKLIESFFESLDVVIGLMEMDREGYQGHTHLVAKYTKLIGRKMGLSRREMDEAVMGAYAHDIGKKGIRHHTLLDTLSEELDPDALKDALEIPVRLLGPAKLPMDLERVLLNSMERYDGKGFPGELSGEDIPVSARILAVVDAFAHITTEGWEGNKYSTPDAVGFLNEHAGTLFDPNVVDTLGQVVRDDMFVGRMDAAKEHILVADNESDVTTLLELKFANAGYMVTVARTGEEALQKAKETPPDFMLIEIDLPGKDGFKLVEEIQGSELGDIPFLYLSRKDDSRLITKAFDLGAEDVINKPVRTEVLFAKVQRIMERIKRSKKAAAPAGQVAGVSGSLSEMSLPDIVQILGAGRRTCLLTIQSNSDKADIYLEDGRIVNAVYDDMKGEEAFYAIIGWTEGTFTINPEVEITERLINKSNDSLMLEGFRRLDEGGKEASPDDISVDGSDFF